MLNRERIAARLKREKADTQISLRISTSLITYLAEQADKLERTVSKLIVAILTQYREEDESQKGNK